MFLCDLKSRAGYFIYLFTQAQVYFRNNEILNTAQCEPREPKQAEEVSSAWRVAACTPVKPCTKTNTSHPATNCLNILCYDEKGVAGV